MRESLFTRFLSLLLLVFCLGARPALAQLLLQSYSFSQNTSGSYVPLTTSASTMVDSGSTMDESRYGLRVPFNFNIDNSPYSSGYIHTNGYITFGSTDPGPNAFYGVAHSGSGFAVIAGMSGNLAGRPSGSRIDTAVLGVAPNRVFVVQYQNMGAPGTTILQVNFQIRLSESTNRIDVVYGTCSHGGTTSVFSNQMGIRNSSGSLFVCRRGGTGSSTWTGTSPGTTSGDLIQYGSGNNPSSGLTFTYTPPPICSAPAKPSGLTLTSTPTTINGAFTGSGADKYMVLMTTTPALTGVPLDGTNYAQGNMLGNGLIIQLSSATSFSVSGLPYYTAYYFHVIPIRDNRCYVPPAYNASTPLTGGIATDGPHSYTWQPRNASGSFQTASNWSPARSAPLPGDTLIFDNNGADTVSAAPTETVERIRISGTTKVFLTSASVSALSVNASLIVDTTAAFSIGGNAAIQFTATPGLRSVRIWGTLELYANGGFRASNANVIIYGGLKQHQTSLYQNLSGSTSIYGPLQLSGSSAYRTGNGFNRLYGKIDIDSAASLDISGAVNTEISDTVNCNGANANVSGGTTGITQAKFLAGSVYNHRRDGGLMPQAEFRAGSVINITGVTTTSPQFSGLMRVGFMFWDCPGQLNAITINAALDSVRNDLHIVNTGSYALTLSQSASHVKGTFYQHSGTVLISSINRLVCLGTMRLIGGTLDIRNTGGFTIGLTVKADMIQSSGHVITNGAAVTSSIEFSGNSHQSIDLGGTFQQVPVNYSLNNPAGVTLRGNLPVLSGCTNAITAGNWTGPGAFIYASGSNLRYNTHSPHFISVLEWPAASGPTNLSINSSGLFPSSLLHMPGSRSLAGNLDLQRGLLSLDSSDLRIGGTLNYSLFPDTTRLIATDGSGRLYLSFPASTSARSRFYPVGSLRDGPVYTGVTLTMYSTTASTSVGVRRVSGKHPADTATSDYLNHYWSFDDGGASAAYAYKLELAMPFAAVSGQSTLHLSHYRPSLWQALAGPLTRSGTAGSFVSLDTLSSAVHSLNGADITGLSFRGSVYTWNGSVSRDFGTAQNWTPVRSLPLPGDILQFSNGRRDTVENIRTQVVGGIEVLNNTTVSLQAGLASNVALAIASDRNTATRELRVDQGSALVLDGVVRSLYMALSGDSARGEIAGRLELAGTMGASLGNRFSFTCPGCVTTVTPTGYIAAGDWMDYNDDGFLNTDTAALVVAGVYEHKFHITAGRIPAATWLPGSLAKISGYTNTTQGFTLSGRSFHDLTYDCPNQTVVVPSHALNGSVRGTLRIVSTGSGSWSFSQNYGLGLTKLKIEGGIFDLRRPSNEADLYISDSLVQTGGVLRNSTPLAVSTIHFTGSGARQGVIFHDAAPAGPFMYRIANPAGIDLRGTGTLTGAFDLTSRGGVRVSVGIPDPIRTGLSLRFGPGSTLTFDGNISHRPDSVVFPELDPPANLRVDIGPRNSLTLPGNRQVPEFLYMVSGDINADSSRLLIGSSASAPGGIYYTSGTVNLSTGELARWFGVTGLPTTIALPSPIQVNTGFFPVGFRGANRNVSVYFSTATALSSGGTLSVRHDHVPGNNNSLLVSDGVTVIKKRSNSSWELVAGNGLAMPSATAGLRITAGSLLGVATPSTLRLMKASSVAGNHIAGSGLAPDFNAQRNGLSFADLTGSPFYVGGDSTNVGGPFFSIRSGNWNTASTWNRNAVPGSMDTVYITGGDTVSVQSAGAARIITVGTQALLRMQQDTLKINGSVDVDGSAVVNGGALQLGPVGGGNRPFTVSYRGRLEVHSGDLLINGNLTINGSGQTMNGELVQTGGRIVVDGNYRANPSMSVAANTPLVSLGRGPLSLTGGTFSIVDPHVFGTNAAGVALAISGDTSNRVTLNHTFFFGDGVSEDSCVGAPARFLLHDPSSSNRFANTRFGNFVVTGAASGVPKRILTHTVNVSVGGALRLRDPGAELQSAGILYLGGNLQADSGTNAYFSGTLHCRSMTMDPAQAVRQTIGGRGTFKGPGLNNFQNIVIQNPAGVVFNTGDIRIGNTVTFNRGILHLPAPATLYMTLSPQLIGSESTGWLNGRLRQLLTVSNRTVVFGVGDSMHYAPVTISGYSQSVDTVTVTAFRGDHPALAGSGINPAASLNRYWTIQHHDTAAAGSSIMQFGFHPDDIDPAARWHRFRGAKYDGAAWTSPVLLSTGGTQVLTDTMTDGFNRIYAFGESGAAPHFLIQPGPDTICVGNTASFAVQADAATSYQWQVDAGSGWYNLADDATYGGSRSATLYVTAATAVLNGNLYRCLAINDIDTARSVHAILGVNGSLSPAVTLASIGGTTVCAGTQLAFTAQGSHGGSAAVYEWFLNGVLLNNSGSGFSYTPSNGDVLRVAMTSSFSCASPARVLSAPLRITVTPKVQPDITIAATTPLPACAGSAVSFTASIAHGGTSPAYQWKVNGSPVGTNSAGFTGSGFQAGDRVVCFLTSNEGCIFGPNDSSAAIVLSFREIPAQPAAISGASLACGTTTETYSVPADTSATSYLWTLPAGWSGSSTSNSISVTPGSSGGTIGVTAVNTCGSSVARALVVSVSAIPAQPGAISGAATVCSGTAQTYTISPVTGAGSYVWTLPSGWSGTSTGNSISVTAGSGSGNLSVAAVNDCGSSAAQTLAVSGLSVPAAPAAITGSLKPCVGSSQVYKIPVVTGAGSYTWTLPSGWSGTSTDTSIAVLAGASAGNLLVSAVNSCGTGPAASLGVSTDSIPGIPGPVSGKDTLCAGAGEVYRIAAVPGAAGYNWTLPSGWSGTSSADTIAATAGSLNGSVSVAATNACGSSAARSLTLVSIAPVSPAVSISASASSICAGQPVSFSASLTNGGANPVYSWMVNGTVAGSQPVFSTTTLAAGDSVILTLRSDARCANPATVSSSALRITVNPVVIPAVTIPTPVPAAHCEGASIVLNASASNTGTLPQYQWFRNGSMISGATGTSITLTPAAGTDSFSIRLMSNAVCANVDSAVSPKVGLRTIPNVTPTIGLVASPAGTVIQGSSVTFTATTSGGGRDSLLIWERNGSSVPGISGPVYVAASVQNGELIRAVLTNREGCATPATVSASATISTTTVGVATVQEAIRMQVVPNPNRGNFELQVSWGAAHVRERAEVRLLNALGQTIYQASVEPKDANWSLVLNLGAETANGLYQLSVTTPSGTTTRAVSIMR